MELTLLEKDASDWIYRGEGAANLVLGYCGSSPVFVGKVIRVQKALKNEPQSTNTDLILSVDESMLWADKQELITSTSKEILGQRFALHVMSPLLGSKHVDPGMCVLVSREFLELVGKNVLSQRPSWRVDAAKVNTIRDSALLISDHSVFPMEDVCIAVELKPKCGFLPSSRFIAEHNVIKKSVTRFRMHQVLKLHKKEISRVSEYDPLDLFSGSRDRIGRAIRALFATPQNNFRVFLNGSLIFGGLGGGMDDTELAASHTPKAAEAFEDLFKGVIQADHGLRLANLLDLIAETIFRSGILGGLLEAQKLDSYDIEGAIHAYYNIISQPCMVCKKLCDAELEHRYSFLHSLSVEESVKIVRDYLVAATAKDCSLIISFKPRKDGNSSSEYSSIVLESTNQTYDYKAYFIDLDMKPLKKMEYYYELDQKIVSCYTEESTENSPSNSLGSDMR
ncbi:inositol-pentakisphosphate 2-kinase IPK1-like [Tasmannia lanceolata]|uniref:inositol-pentakisphosphate 2-kinase IPK1-like n=1 Tax=Tasmannia lanceolata TaxID=3420 RepID=UPI0040647FA6